MRTPSKQDLKVTIETIEWLKEYTERTEPYATNFIEACEAILLGIPEHEDLQE